MRIGLVAALCLTASLLAAASAQASPCPGEPPHEQRFAEWGDEGNYFLAPGGDFESASGGWALEGVAALLAGISPAPWNASLAVPPLSSAVSPPICVARGYTHGRMFGEAIDVLRRQKSKLRIDVLQVVDGQLIERRASAIRLQRDWDATETFSLDERRFVLDPETGLGEIRLRLTTVGVATALLDGVYIDPSARN